MLKPNIWRMVMKRKLLIIILCAIVCTTLLNIDINYYLITGFQIDESKANPKDLQPFQAELTEDFPTVSADEPRIPHIIHQTYISTLIPNQFVDNIKSFVKKNPKWVYYFWTDESARQLIKDRHPILLDVWDNYQDSIDRVNAFKYIVLYEFGGIYVDIDVDCLRPLNRATMKYACIFPPEPFEHGIFENEIPYIINNAIMMCRPKHPFLKLLITKIAHSAAFIEDKTDSNFVTFVFMLYNNLTDLYKQKSKQEGNSPYFYTGELKEDDPNAVYVPNTGYFTDTIADFHWHKHNFYHMCRNYDVQSTLVRRACYELLKKGFRRQASRYAFTHHHWYHMYNYEKKSYLYKLFFGYSYTELSHIVPNYKTYPNIAN